MAMTRQAETVWRVFVVLHWFSAAAIVGYLVGSLLLSGGQPRVGESPHWGVIVPAPIFVVPAWLLAVPAAAGVALLVPTLVGLLRRGAELDALPGTWGATVPAVLAPVLFAGVYADGEDTWRFWESQSYWVPTALAGVSWVILLAVNIVVWIAHAVASRRRRSFAEPD